MAGVGAVIDVIRDRILKIAGAIAKFFSGDFKGALSDARAAVSGIGDEIAEEFQKAADATKKLQEVEDAMRDLGVSRAKLNRDLAETKEIITDESASLEDKRKAIERVRKAEGEQTAQELENAKKKLQAIKDRNALSDVSDERAQEEADAQAAVYALEEKSANDIRALNKQSRAIEKQEEAKRKEERQKAIEAEKAERQKLVEFTNKLTKLQQENELALIKDGYQKELKQLENRIADEKRQNELAFKDRKLTREQLNKLNEALDIQANIQRSSINDKHNEDVKKKEEAFQKELAEITGKTKAAAIKDANQAELLQLEIGYQEKLKQAIEKYKDDTAKLEQIKAAIDEQYRAEKAAKEAKIKEDEDKKKFEADAKKLETTIADTQATLDQRKAALDAEQVLVQQAFDNKILTEEQYNAKLKELSAARKSIDEIEAQNKVKTYQILSSAANAFADLIGKNTVAGKVAATAATLINTYEAAWSIFRNASKNPASIPFPAYPYIQAGLAIVAGLKTVNDIVKVKVPGSGGGGSVPATASVQAPAAPLAPTQTSTSLDQATINNIGNAAAGGVNAVRAYVVEQDSAAAAARSARLSGAAVLGG
jgi:chemotaxis protein histidine kinase CheA